MIIDENQLSSAHNRLNISKFKSKKTQPPHNNRQRRPLLIASSYPSIVQAQIDVRYVMLLRTYMLNSDFMYLRPPLLVYMHYLSQCSTYVLKPNPLGAKSFLY